MTALTPQMASYYPRFRRSQLVADKIREMIASGKLTPGSRLATEQQLCKEFGVSRTTLREATQMLRSEGLLDVTPGRGSYVCRPELLPRLKAIAFAVGGEPGMTAPHAFELLERTLVPLVPLVCKRPAPTRQIVLNYLLQAKLGGDDNAELERAWVVLLPDLSLSPMAGLVCRMLLEVVGEERSQLFADPVFVGRCATAQLRVANALAQGDAMVAARLLTQYFDLARGSNIPLQLARPA